MSFVFFLVFGTLSVAAAQNTPTYTPYPGFPLQDVERALLAYQTDFGMWPTDVDDLELYAEATGQNLQLDRFSVLTLEPKSDDTVRIIYAEKGTDTEPNEHAITVVTVGGQASDKLGVKQADLATLDPKTLVKRIQVALTGQGYNAGPVDGIVGKRTRQAIRQFQKDQGLPVDGEATASLLAIQESSAVRPGTEPGLTSLTPDPLLAQKVQRELKRRGYDPGPPDGIVGPQTRQAMKHFLLDRQASLRGPQADEGSRTPATVPPVWMSVREQIRHKLWPNHIRRP
jgi:peptidoglycan hydrolase-like protein with peptidoglycan-binding domain